MRVAIIYHIWPHYRQAVATAMDRSNKIQYSFFGSGEPYEGVKHADTRKFRHFVVAPHKKFGSLLWQTGAVRAAFSDDYDAVIYLSDLHFLSNWLGAFVARLRGIPVLFWGHGWRREERGAKRLLRNAFYRLADRQLVYGERAKEIGARSGYPRDRITVVYNSLDVAAADQIIADIEGGRLNGARPQSLFAQSDRNLVICTARLIPTCRFDLLIKAAAILARRGRPINILLVGDGSEREALADLARQLSVDVHFYGSCYDESIIGQFIYHADLTVSPGKIGLTAMHSLMYGAPAITHGNLDEQMPEVEALQEGNVGGFFDQGDEASLADAMQQWFDAPRERAQVRAAARDIVHRKWNADVQAEIIERALLNSSDKRRARLATT